MVGFVLCVYLCGEGEIVGEAVVGPRWLLWSISPFVVVVVVIVVVAVSGLDLTDQRGR